MMPKVTVRESESFAEPFEPGFNLIPIQAAVANELSQGFVGFRQIAVCADEHHVFCSRQTAK